MMHIVTLSTEQAQAQFEGLPSSLRIATLSPVFAAADAQRDPGLRCVHASLQGGDFEWLYSLHLRPLPSLAGESAAWGATAPYGYGGPVTPSSDPDFLFKAWAAWQTWCRAEGVLAEFCRFHPHAPNSIRAFFGTVRENRCTISVDLTLPNLAANFNFNTRRTIGRAQQAGVQTRWSRDPHDWMRYALFYRQAMRDIQAAPFYLFPDAYFEALARLPFAHLLLCERQGRWLSGGVYLLGGGVLEYHLGAGSPEGKDVGAPYLMQLEAATWAKVQGAHSLYLGGGTDTAPDNPLLFYKRRFSRRTLMFSVGEAIHDANRYWRVAGDLGFSPERPPSRILFD